MAGNGKAKPSNGGNGNGNGGNGSKATAKRKMQRKRNRAKQTTQRINQTGIMLTSQNFRPLDQENYTFRGSDFLTTLEIKISPTPSERILKTVEISPSLFQGTRLTQLSALWERYRFKTFRMRYVPAVPTTVACQIMCFIDTDPTDDPTTANNADSLIRLGTAHTGSQQWNFNTPKTIPLPMRKDDQLYYTGPVKQNQRFNLQGKAYFIQVTDPVNFNADLATDSFVAGSIYIDWVCNFQLAQLASEGILFSREAGIDSAISAGTEVTADYTTKVFFGLKPNTIYIVVGNRGPTAVTGGLPPGGGDGSVGCRNPSALDGHSDILRGVIKENDNALSWAGYLILESNQKGEAKMSWKVEGTTPPLTFNSTTALAFVPV